MEPAEKTPSEAITMSIEELDEFKRLRREKDAQDLASGAKTREQLMYENGFFAFPKGTVEVIVHYHGCSSQQIRGFVDL